MSRHCFFTAICASVLAFFHPDAAGSLRAQEAVPITFAGNHEPADDALAKELAAMLRQVYPSTEFIVGANEEQVRAAARTIILGRSSDARLCTLLGADAPAHPESYQVTVRRDDAREFGIIAGADTRGLAYGVYGLLQNLGHGFFLSYNTEPQPRPTPFSWDGWQIADRPLTPDRIVFNWHNFLSGCSTWDFADWRTWIRQSRKMGFNGIMVHAYGNNPMASFEFHGKTKPVGYLSTTERGRDWATMHINDVRRLHGGSVFPGPVFGAKAGQASEDERATAARQLMQSVFAEAAAQSMNIFFSIDMDTLSANPQELIRLLPEHARFAFPARTQPPKLPGGTLANPDTPEGYQFYKEQIRQLLRDYPRITCLALWLRKSKTPWTTLKRGSLPRAWQAEYTAALAQSPDAAQEPRSVALFALGKVMRAWQRALRELNLAHVRLATGSWNFDFLPAAHRFLPGDITLIGLDYGVLKSESSLASPEHLRKLAAVASQRPVIPVIWAHHDDGNYIGRPYAPFENFNARLTDARASGFGIIHWTTRPLDLFFTSHIKQTWQRTENEALAETCRAAALQCFGEKAASPMGEYLHQWITDAPIFGRETGPLFIDHPLKKIDETIAGCARRMLLLENTNAANARTLSSDANNRLGYCLAMEGFIAAFFENQSLFQQAGEAFKNGRLDEARALLRRAQPDEVITQYARLSSLCGITKGEQGLLVSLNTRWLTHFISLRQKLRMDPVRIAFGETSHDPLAQSPGTWTFTIDADGNWWQRLGTKETKVQTFANPSAENEIARAGIASRAPIGPLKLKPLLMRDDFAPGRYRARFLFVDPEATAAGENVFSISIDGKPVGTMDIFKETGARGKTLERAYEVSLETSRAISITLTPISGQARLSGLIMEPLD